MVELTACVFKDSIPSQYDDSQLVVCFQYWGVFSVKHVMVKKRAHLVDQVGNPVKQDGVTPSCSRNLKNESCSLIMLWPLACF